MMDKIPEKILEHCKKKGITVNKLASLSGLTQSTINTLIQQKGQRPRVDTLEKICRGIDIKLKDFIAEIESSSRKN